MFKKFNKKILKIYFNGFYWALLIFTAQFADFDTQSPL